MSYFAHTQTDKQTNKVWQKHYLLGGGNNKRICIALVCRFASEALTGSTL